MHIVVSFISVVSNQYTFEQKTTSCEIVFDYKSAIDGLGGKICHTDLTNSLIYDNLTIIDAIEVPA